VHCPGQSAIVCRWHHHCFDSASPCGPDLAFGLVRFRFCRRRRGYPGVMPIVSHQGKFSVPHFAE
jgi:hypothetical protein